MYEVIESKGDKLEVLFNGQVTQEDFQQVAHHIESMCASHQNINVLFDLSGAGKIDPDAIPEEHKSFKENSEKFDRMAVVGNEDIVQKFSDKMKALTNVQVTPYPEEKIDDARRFIFPSPLP